MPRHDNVYLPQEEEDRTSSFHGQPSQRGRTNREVLKSPRLSAIYTRNIRPYLDSTTGEAELEALIRET